jgi:hypothetical protein
MQYPAKISWFDRPPEVWEDHTVSLWVSEPQELDAALDRFDRDMRRLQFSLAGRIIDREGRHVAFGFSEHQELGYASFRLQDDSMCPWLIWSLRDTANTANVQQLTGRDRIDFHYWPGLDPWEVRLANCVPITALRRAIHFYLASGTFDCIAWGGQK